MKTEDEFHHKKYTIRSALPNEISGIVRLGEELVGNAHIPNETLMERFSKNQNIITCLHEATHPTYLIGYFILYPLTNECIEGIESLDIVNGRDIRLDHIANDILQSSGLYIGMIGGRGGFANGYVVKELMRSINSISNTHGIDRLYARGVTANGKKILNRLGMKRLPEPSEISCRRE